ncbi:MAG: endolytic transglycosylase MltG [Cyanobacteria bacterium]|nr:endolytic transglycosylase MltG [Cyanobacteriota bacterium]MDA0865882.1 endolytic transglycosylase MltG [Cyanobacteriota bacterium]
MTSRVSKAIFFLGVLPIAMGVAGWQGWAWWSWATSAVEPPAEAVEPSPVYLQIPTGTSGQQIGSDLEAAGLIRSRLAWNLWSRWQDFRNAEGGYQAGTYVLSPQQSLPEIAAQIWNGEILEASFTIPEGWNREQMAISLEEQGFFPAADFLAATQQIPLEDFPWLPNNLPHLEGFLYPDTYQIPTETITPEAIIAVMLSRFESVALPVYEAAASDFSLLEWVTLASIVEKEAVIADERSEIAAVFNRRLEEGIPLGADPTVEYGLGIRQTPENPLTYAQVQTASPYNTYINVGLTPTPISSPGIASLEASLAPPGTEYLYFVARYDGTHVFSRTLAEHEAAQGAIHDALDAAEAAGETPPE